MNDSDKTEKELKNLSIKKIAEAVAYFYGFSVVELKQKGRKKEVVLARHIAIYLSRKYALKSYPVIGSYFGSRDHTTAIHAYKKILYLLDNSDNLLQQISEITKILHGESVDPFSKIVIPKIKTYGQIKRISPLLGFSSPEKMEREKRILEEYRKGKTLDQVGEDFNLTRERIRQLVQRAILREIAEQEAEGFEIDLEEYIKQEKLKIKKDRSLLNNPIVEKKPKHWSRFYASCRSCGTDTIPHFKRGYCERCLGILNKERRDQVILSRGGKCENCGIERSEARRQFGRDFYITGAKNWKDFKILCRGCFLKETGQKLSKSRLNRKTLQRSEKS